MENCCSHQKSESVNWICPQCGKKGRRVSSVTLVYHIPKEQRGKIGQVAGFCSHPSCSVVYFDSEKKTIITKGETRFPVTVKDDREDVNVCYCFDYKRSDIRHDLETTGTTTIPDRIKKEVQKGQCDCERKNPQGTCCLGNVAQEVKAIGDERAGRKR